MNQTTTDLRRSLRYILHWGCVEIRNLAYKGGSDDQIAYLADILEYLPRFLDEDREPDPDVIREQFEGYARRFPDSTYRYLDYLNPGNVPDRY